jgi:hypothetical protein
MRQRIPVFTAIAIVAAIIAVIAMGPFAAAGGFQPIAGGDCSGSKCK